MPEQLACGARVAGVRTGGRDRRAPRPRAGPGRDLRTCWARLFQMRRGDSSFGRTIPGAW